MSEMKTPDVEMDLLVGRAGDLTPPNEEMRAKPF
jgi:hypothetical protein